MSNFIADTERGDERANVGHDGAKGAGLAEGRPGELAGSDSKEYHTWNECKRLVRCCSAATRGQHNACRCGRQVSGGTGGCQWDNTAVPCLWRTRQFGSGTTARGTLSV